MSTPGGSCDRPNPGSTEPVAAQPLAIVGMACRFPGGIETPADYWKFLVTGQNAIGEIAAERWEGHRRSRPGNAAAMRGTTRYGGFLTDPAAFDAEFFGVTPREAELMDPQQRLALETTWEALEHAGIPPHSLAARDVGVFMGVGSDDYGRQMLEDLPRIEAWTGVGAACCAVANRISYVLDLHGPSFTMDAACASSLVAIHLACANLRTGENTVAIAGGVNVMAAPGLTMVLDAAQAISPDGHSRPFDAEANGYVRGEGVGVVILKRLADAQRDGDPVLAVIRGSAISHNGRTSGIMAPNSAAQERVARLALRQAGVDAESVDYIEAHGTGTGAGDPAEAAALSAVFGAGRPPHLPCLIGSVKANIGHLEAAAGVAGVIKAVLALMHDEIPPQVGFTRPSHAIPWERSGLRVATDKFSWPRSNHPRRAGVASSGYGGAVAHIILEQAPEATHAPEDSALVATDGTTAQPRPQLFPLSAASPEAVRAYAACLADVISDRGGAPKLVDLRHTLWRRRTHLPSRAAVVADGTASLRYELRRLASDQPSPLVTTGTALSGTPTEAVWIFSGHGSQWPGMGRELLQTDRAFARTVDEIDPIFVEEAGFSPRQALLDGKLGDVGRIQSLIFVMHMGLAATWRELGLRPAAVMGHSVGEVAAAVTAGVFSLSDGARLICRRSRLLRKVAGAGAMAMVHLPFEEVRALQADCDVEAAIESSPASTVVAGNPAGIAAFKEMCEQADFVVRPVRSDVAFHSRQMDPLLADLESALADLVPAAPAIPLYTTALTDPRANPARTGDYWAANLRNPVRLASAVAGAAEDGHHIFLELSPHPVIAHSVGDTLSQLEFNESFVTGSLRRDRPERATLLASLGALYCHGCDIDAKRPGGDGALVTLPRPAWRHRRFWRGPELNGGWDSELHDLTSGSLLGPEITVADPAAPQIWRTRLDYRNRPYPGNHPVQGVEIVPAAVILNTFFAATGQRSLTSISFQTVLPVAAVPREVQVLANAGVVRLVSRPIAPGQNEEASWQTHATATAAEIEMPRGTFDVKAAMSRCPRQPHPDSVVQRLRALGIGGTGLNWAIDELAAGDNELTARVRLDGGNEDADLAWARLLDALLSLIPLLDDGDPVLRLVAGIERVALTGRLPAAALIHLRAAADSRDRTEGVITDSHGAVLGVVDGIHFLPLEGLPATSVNPRRFVHRIEWRQLPAAPPGRALRTVVLVGEDSALRDALVRRAKAEQVPCLTTTDPGPYLEQLLTRIDEDGALDDRAAVIVCAASSPEDGTPPIDPAAVAEAAVSCSWRLARTAQMIAARKQPRAPLLWCVTAGLRESETCASLPQTTVWGLGQIIAGEHPDFWGGIVDLDPSAPDTGSAALFAALRSRRDPDLLALRGELTEAARLVSVVDEPVREAFRCHADATYLITGGLGALGLEVAGWLASRGARRLVLAGRTPMPPRSQWNELAGADEVTSRRVERILELEALGVTVRPLALDIADADAASAALSQDALGLPPIRGVVHAAGTLDNRLVGDLDPDSLRRVMRPKIQGAIVLDRLFPPGSLDFFFLFSSFGQFLGLTGQASYASANAFLDGLARYRRGVSKDGTVSLCWTSWRGLGMGISETVSQELASCGIGDISAADAFLAWAHASRYDEGQLCIFPTVDHHRKAALPPMLRQLEFSPETGDEGGQASIPTLSPDLTPEQICTAVSREVAAQLHMDFSDLSGRFSLTNFGLDSVMIAAIRRRLEERFGLQLPATLLWNNPTIANISDYVAERLIPVVSAGAGD